MDSLQSGLTAKPVEFLDIVYHMSLLRWFSEVGFEASSNVTNRFLLRAEQRYRTFWALIIKNRPDPATLALPPIDVLLMWHSHLLRPGRYLEDLYRWTNDDSLLKYSIPLKRINTAYLRKKTVDAADIKAWTSATGLPYEIDVRDKSPFKVECSWCDVKYDIPCHLESAQNLCDVRYRYDQACDLGIQQIEACYRGTVGPFSLNLCATTMVNLQTIRKIVPNFWSNPDLVKRHANQYFEYLVALNEHDTAAADSFEADVAWLSHMLRPAAYHDYNLMFAHRLIEFEHRTGDRRHSANAGKHGSQDHPAEFMGRASTATSETSSSSGAQTRPTPVLSLTDQKFIEKTRERELQEHAKRMNNLCSDRGSVAYQIPGVNAYAQRLQQQDAQSFMTQSDESLASLAFLTENDEKSAGSPTTPGFARQHSPLHEATNGPRRFGKLRGVLGRLGGGKASDPSRLGSTPLEKTSRNRPASVQKPDLFTL
ncbi:hypothetical protein IWQ60_005055 [Tieghemiomyces parasiticus]|uniref:Uncharacterized protein n=1 Tax=Tieghemiomyces parasiticus TaxID=78921 RepID=A0A9W8DZ76_9FUNG|nr:hypothetical protein IWQ60_005055 [Tieghemiomyces parasiticus]